MKRIVLTRPAVEAGESLGFLPGDLKEPRIYANGAISIIPLSINLAVCSLPSTVFKPSYNGLKYGSTFSIAPLAYMRGRTLDDAFVILDEAQNTTHAQMKMFLTRLGFGSKMVVTGDHTRV